jgi:hypothetical protein
MIQSGWPDSTGGYKFSGDEGMGRCEVALVSSCNKNNTKRLMWGFGGLGVLSGADVSSATFSAYGAHSYSCTSKTVRVYRVDSFGSSATWNNRSGWGDSRKVDYQTVAHKPACDNDRWIEWDVTSAAQWAAGNSSALYLGLRAKYEDSMANGWKRYRYDAKLSVTYNHQPNKPTNLRATSPTMPCTGAVSDRPWTRDNTPVLRATFTDKDTSQNLRGHFYWEKHDGSSYTSRVSKNTGVYAAQGEQAYQMPTLSDGWYRWQSRGYDKIIHSEYSSYCYFVVDTTPPAAPSVSISAPYLFGWWHDPVVGLPQATITVSRGSDTTVGLRVCRVGLARSWGWIIRPARPMGGRPRRTTRPPGWARGSI